MEASGDRVAQIWDMLPRETPPAWRADLAEFASTQVRYDASREPRLDVVRTLREKLLATTSADPREKFGRWYFAESDVRATSPWSTVRLKEYVDGLAAAGDKDSLDYAISLSQDISAWMVKLVPLRAIPRIVMKPFHRAIAVCVLSLALAGTASAQVNITTWQVDPQHTGNNASETILSPGNISSPGNFGLLFTQPPDGQTYGQTLLVSGLTVLLPDQTGPPTHLRVGGGKGAVLYVVDRDNNSTDDSLVTAAVETSLGAQTDPDLAIFQPATASSVNGGNTAAMAVDSNTTTRWESTPGRRSPEHLRGPGRRLHRAFGRPLVGDGRRAERSDADVYAGDRSDRHHVHGGSFRRCTNVVCRVRLDREGQHDQQRGRPDADVRGAGPHGDKRRGQTAHPFEGDLTVGRIPAASVRCPAFPRKLVKAGNSLRGVPDCDNNNQRPNDLRARPSGPICDIPFAEAAIVAPASDSHFGRATLHPYPRPPSCQHCRYFSLVWPSLSSHKTYPVLLRRKRAAGRLPGRRMPVIESVPVDFFSVLYAMRTES